MTDERRQILEQAFDKYSEGEDTPVHEVVEKIQEAKPEEHEGENRGDGKTEPGAVTETPVEVKEAKGPNEGQGEKPKFLPPEAGGEETQAIADAAGKSEPEKAPVSWRGDAKSHWGELPVEVQKEVLRREQETSKVLRDTAEARRLENEFNQIVQPYMGFIKAENSTPLQAFTNLMQTAATLRVGTQQQKAALAADMIHRYEIDLNMLDRLLVGQQPSAGPQGAMSPEVQQYLDQRLAPVNELMGRVTEAQQQRSQQTNAEVEKELDEFLNSGKATYFEDVKEAMADLLDVADRRGRKMTYQEAYDIAVSLDPGISEKMKQQQQAQTQQIAQKEQEISLARKKRASSSVTGVPVSGNGATAPTNRTDQLEAAWELHEGGRA